MGVVEKTVSVTDQAREMFVKEVQRIPGARVELYGMRAGNPTIRVFLPSRLSPDWRRVYDLEGQMLDRFPGAHLDVWLSEERPQP